MIIADKTIANVMAYTWLVLQTPPASREADVPEAMKTFCQALGTHQPTHRLPE